jgi:hypothetical protein
LEGPNRIQSTSWGLFGPPSWFSRLGAITSPALEGIPAVILTTSASKADILRSYLHDTNYYITERVDREGFLNVVRRIDNFWLPVVELQHEEFL